MIIAHNMLAQEAQRYYGINGKSRAKTMEKLSSGYKINRSADDAAGLSISEKMRLQIRGLKQGTDNIQDGISLVQVADGALGEIVDNLQRINELSIKAYNGTNSRKDREYCQYEKTETVAFSKKVYPYEEPTRKISEAIGSEVYIPSDLQIISDALDYVSQARSYLGAVQNRLEHAYNNNNNKHENTTASESRIRDADIAKEAVENSRSSILQQVGEAAMVL